MRGALLGSLLLLVGLWSVQVSACALLQQARKVQGTQPAFCRQLSAPRQSATGAKAPAAPGVARTGSKSQRHKQ